MEDKKAKYREYQAEYYQKNKARIYTRDNTPENKEKRKEYRRKRYHDNRLKPLERAKEYYYRNSKRVKERARISGKLYRDNIKMLCLARYSIGDTPKCSAPGCSIEDIDMLQIDHIDNNGGEHRREIKAVSNYIYRWLIKNEFPPGFQVLCANHNIKKEIERRRKNLHQAG